MSAFVCNTDHFKALALFAVSRQHGSYQVDPRYVRGMVPPVGADDLAIAVSYADTLYAENVRSVECRYPGTGADSLPGEIFKPASIRISANDLISARFRVSPVAILKMCDCLEYQSCETDNYRETVAFRLLDSIRGAAIRMLPGYESAQWSFSARAAA